MLSANLFQANLTTYVFASNSKKPQYNDNEPERVSGFFQLLLFQRNKVHNHPHQTQKRHEHIQTITSALPVSKKSQGAGLHEHLHQKQQREHRRK